MMWFRPEELRIQGLADTGYNDSLRLFMNSEAGTIEFAMADQYNVESRAKAITGKQKLLAMSLGGIL